jgi:hypothetical protein
MRPTDAVRLVAALGAVEMALVRRDAVAGPLLAQAVRAADGTEVHAWLSAAARLVRESDPRSGSPEAGSRRKIAQALCRAAATAVQADVLSGASPDTPQ